MNNEPVAWMLLSDESCVEITEWFGVMRGWEDFLGDNEKIVELYTHPHSEESVKVKGLTDAEIIKLFENDELWTRSSIVYQDDAIDFARAILRKAQEK